MKFIEEKAKEIVLKYGLSETTIKVWRTRGAIPNKYLDDNFVPRKTINRGDSLKHDRILSLIKSGQLNLKVFSELTKLPEMRFHDAARKGVLLSEQDLLTCQVELKRLKIEVSKTFETFSPRLLKKLLNNPLIAYSVVIKNEQMAKRVSYLRLKNTEPDKLFWSDLKDHYVVFALQI